MKNLLIFSLIWIIVSLTFAVYTSKFQLLSFFVGLQIGVFILCLMDFYFDKK